MSWREIEEGDETNNTASFVVRVVSNQADLTVSSFSLSGSSDLVAGETIGPRLAAQVDNIGVAECGQFSVGFYLSTDLQITTADTLLFGGREFEDGLATGGSLSVGIAPVMGIPSDIAPGTYFLGVIADELEGIEEGDETNNTASFVVRVVSNQADLTVSSFSLSGSSDLVAGETIGPRLAAQVDNIGVADAGPFAVGFYLSTDLQITTADTLLFGGREFEDGLATGGSLSVGIAPVMGIPSDIAPGTYFLGVIADELEGIEEGDETNNTAFFMINIVDDLPDLTVTSLNLSGPSNLAVGATIGPRLAVTIDNIGVTECGQFSVGFYLSTDASITTADTLLTGGREYEDGLAAGDSLPIEIATVMAVPNDIAPGRYFLGVIADELEANEEIDETNNTSFIVVNIVDDLPDLTVGRFCGFRLRFFCGW